MPLFNFADSLRIGSRTVAQTRKGAARTFPMWNEATGGTVTTVANYNGTGEIWKVHTFTTNQNMVILNASNPFRVLVQGGGAGWGVFWSPGGTGSGGGSGGTDERASFTTTPGTYAVVVGGRGHNGGYQVFGGAGGTSSIFGISATGGTTNGNYPMSNILRGTPPGGAPTGGLTSDITGSSYGYAGAYGGSNYGAGSTWSPHGGGAQGVVIVSYRIA